jgi:hypothetical protein
MANLVATWTTGQGSQAMSQVLASFVDQEDGIEYVVVRCGRSIYDVTAPFTVLRAAECDIRAD